MGWVRLRIFARLFLGQFFGHDQSGANEGFEWIDGLAAVGAYFSKIDGLMVGKISFEIDGLSANDTPAGSESRCTWSIINNP
jgi:hypothetical protein